MRAIKGVEQDYGMARNYYQLASDHGDDMAQYNLGIYYYFGFGVEQDYSEAYRYFCLAAEQGYAEGCLQSENAITWGLAWIRIWEPPRNGIRRHWMPDLSQETKKKLNI